MAWRPSLCAIEGRLSRMGFWFTVIATCGVTVSNMTFAQSCHFYDIAGGAAQCPTSLRVHHVFQFLLERLGVSNIVGEHHELQVLRYLPTAVVSAAA